MLCFVHFWKKLFFFAKPQTSIQTDVLVIFDLFQKKRQNGRNFWHEVTFLSKMEKMRSEIKKTVCNPLVVLFPLFISEKKNFFSPNPKPLFKLAFWSFWLVAEISAMRSAWRCQWWLLSVSEKKKHFFWTLLGQMYSKLKQEFKTDDYKKKY